LSIPQLPLFVKTHDFTVWLLRHTQRLPKNLRHSYTNGLESACFEFEELALKANSVRGSARTTLLVRADGQLLWLRALLRYTLDFGLLGGPRPLRQKRRAARVVSAVPRASGRRLARV
jgi:hypothetical protein